MSKISDSSIQSWSHTLCQDIMEIIDRIPPSNIPSSLESHIFKYLQRYTEMVEWPSFADMSTVHRDVDDRGGCSHEPALTFLETGRRYGPPPSTKELIVTDKDGVFIRNKKI